MNIYLLTQTENNNWDTYDSCVVIAETEEAAKLIHPSGNHKFRFDCNEWMDDYSYNIYLIHKHKYSSIYNYTWCQHPTAVTVKYIGEFKGNLDDYPSRIVCASFNAG